VSWTQIGDALGISRAEIPGAYPVDTDPHPLRSAHDVHR
jgi:hypothetical protein